MPGCYFRDWAIPVLFSTLRVFLFVLGFFIYFFFSVCKFNFGKLLLLKTSSRNLLIHYGYGFDLLVSEL